MYNLVAPAWDDDQDYDDVVLIRRAKDVRQHLQRSASRVKATYPQYVAHVPDLAQLGAISMTSKLADRLVSTYKALVKSKRIQARALKTRLYDSLRHGSCPYCAVGTASTFDHYLPSRAYPEFSVFAKNLVPACKDCNHSKGFHIGGSAIDQVLHPYFDGLPDQYLITVDLTFGGVMTVTYRLALPPATTMPTLLRAAFQFQRLGLANRYRKEALLYLASNKAAFQRQFDKDGTGVILRDEIVAVRQSLESVFGKIHWKVALLRALELSPAFLSGGFKEIA